MNVSPCNVSTALKNIPELNEFVTKLMLSQKEWFAGLHVLYAVARGPQRQPVSEITKTLFVVLSENGGLASAPGVMEGFKELVSQYKGVPLLSDIQRKLKASLKRSQVAQTDPGHSGSDQ